LAISAMAIIVRHILLKLVKIATHTNAYAALATVIRPHPHSRLHRRLVF
jgi:hypothetical protein